MVGGLDLDNPLHRALVLTDAEGAPVAAVDVDRRLAAPGRAGAASAARCAGSATAGTARSGGCAARPAEVRPLLPPGRVLGVVADRPLHRPQLAQIALRRAHPRRPPAGPHSGRRARPGRPGPGGAGAAASSPPATGCPRRPSWRCRWPAAATRSATRCCGPGSPRAYGVTHLLATGARCSPAAGRASWSRASWPTTAGTASGAGADDIPPRNRRLALTAGRDRRPARPGLPAAGVAHPAGGRPRAGPGPPAAAAPRPGGLLHRAVRLGQVHHRPWRRRRAARRPATARSPCSTATWCAA